MEIEQAYNIWAKDYDQTRNRTRDLERLAMINCLGDLDLKITNCLEVGCGTGKNTDWLCSKSDQVLSIDISERMLQAAKKKVKHKNVRFEKHDIRENWNFKLLDFQLITFSLVVAHVENLDKLLMNACKHLNKNGHIYIGEMHPYKFYSGSKAWFNDGLNEVHTFTHNISDYLFWANKNDLQIISLQEFFDDDNRKTVPRILSLLLKKY
ncbi:class I SAM-dependent methyltransferase [Roseivirga pacifica]|uniref:class I SAM-dependent methyltransferase n=1 Tax=Roseivirga pacifica TaxID=1267423 RepID=UPI00227ACA00|nr:class I SAM-dependent methyltransferase [Roseivirga pacifica]